jgi:hypothetical protein
LVALLVCMMIHFVVAKEVASPVGASKTHLMLVAFTTERFTGVGKSVKELTDRHLACCWYRPPAHSLRQMISALTNIIIEFESPPPI